MSNMDGTGPKSADTRVNQFVLPHGAKSTRPVDGRCREFVKHDTHNGPHLTGDQSAPYPRWPEAEKCQLAMDRACGSKERVFPAKDGEPAAVTAAATKGWLCKLHTEHPAEF